MKPIHTLFSRQFLAATILTISALLAACDNDTGSTSLPGGHDHHHGGGAGRLVFADSQSATVYVYDLEEQKTLADFQASHEPSALHASPDYRYALIFQRPNNENEHQVQFLDSGIWLHGDHAHADEPKLLPYTLYGIRPAHYRSHAGRGAIFFDGGSDANALRFAVFNDASLTSGTNHGMIGKEENADAHHGIAEVGNGYVLATYSVAGVVQGVTHYELHGDHFHNEGQLTSNCVRLHGGSSNAHFSAFGCEDGVLVTEFHNGHFHNHKIAITDDNDEPVRITQVAGHVDVEQFAAFATGNQKLYVIDPEAESFTLTNWDDNDGATRQLHGFDAHGEQFLVLGTDGTLYVLDTDNWQLKGKVPVLDSADTTPATAWTVNQANNTLYVTDVTNRAIKAINLSTLALEAQSISLDVTPKGLVWTGVVDEQPHDHSH